MGIDRATVDRWLGDYVAAWKSYDHAAVSALFAPDVVLRYRPHAEAITGRDDVVASWLGEGGFASEPTRDEPETYDASYSAVAVDGDVAVAVGVSTYFDRPGGEPETVYDNCFLMRFDDEGRCREFTEWYVERPKPDGAGAG